MRKKIRVIEIGQVWYGSAGEEGLAEDITGRGGLGSDGSSLSSDKAKLTQSKDVGRTGEKNPQDPRDLRVRVWSR